MTLFEILRSLRQANPRIDRATWPLSAYVDELGRLCVREVPLTEVANQFGTPTFEAAATLGGWDRAVLEADPNRLPPQSARRTSFGSAQPRQRRASS
jgi:hypothetical protein